MRRPPDTPTAEGGAVDPTPTVIAVRTRQGPAAAHVHRVHDARATLVLGHGAGGGVGAPDLLVATAAATGAGADVVLVEQPYRVAGRRVPPRAPALDAAWVDVVDHLRDEVIGPRPLVVGGRSSGARVACRTADATGATGVLCLAFPLRPPSRAGQPGKPSRLAELDGVRAPVLVVQGERDPFGVPPPGPRRTVTTVSGDHALRGDAAAVRTAVVGWLHGLLGDGPGDPPGPGGR